MKITITGASGYIGSALCSRAKARAEPGSSALSIQAIDLLLGDDITTKATQDKIVSFRPDVIVNLAALSGESACRLDTPRAECVNAEAVYTLKSACPTARFIQASTASVLSNTGKYHTPYAWTKTTAEKELLRWNNALVLRFGTVFGACSDLSATHRWDTPINKMFRDGVEKGEIEITGPGKWRPWVWLDSLVELLFQVMTGPDLSADHPVPVCEFNLPIGVVANRIAQEIAWLKHPYPRVVVREGPDADPRDYRMFPRHFGAHKEENTLFFGLHVWKRLLARLKQDTKVAV